MPSTAPTILRDRRALAWRRWLFQVHLWLALVLGPVLAVVCVTGSVVVLRYELNRITVPGTAYVKPHGARLSLDGLTARIRANRPNDQLSSASWTAAPIPA